jgi:hypothetical protein
MTLRKEILQLPAAAAVSDTFSNFFYIHQVAYSILYILFYIIYVVFFEDEK